MLQEARREMDSNLGGILTPGVSELQIVRVLKAKQMPVVVERLQPNIGKFHGDASEIIETRSPRITTPLSTCMIHVEFRLDTQRKLVGHAEQIYCKETLLGFLM